MEWYKVLGVDIGANEKEIKVAYSKLIKIKGPDIDPEGYKELRSAFDTGIKILKNKKRKPSYIEYEDGAKDLNHTSTVQDSLSPIKNEISDYSFKESLDKLYLILADRVNIDNWRILINSEFMWENNGFKTGEGLIINKISKNPYIPDEVIKLLSEYFNWTERELELYDTYDKDSIDKLVSLINNPSGIDYKSLINFKDTRGNYYMEYREKAEENYKMLALDNAFEYSKKAYEIYQEDEVILGILAIYYYYNDKLNMALEYTNRALSINENYYNSCILRGVMLFKEKKYTEALIYFNKPKEYEDDIAKYISNFYHGNCYYKLENFIEAKRLLLNVKCRSKKFLKNDLENTNRRLNGEKVVGENRGIEANDKAVRKFIKAKNRVVKGSKWEIIKFATILFIGLLYLPISVIIKFFGVVFGYNPVKIKSVDNLLALKDETRIKLFITNIRITNYYLVSENKLHYEILKEQEIYDRKLWSYVEAVVLIGKCHERDLLFTGKNFSINDLNVKDHYGTIFGKIDSLDDKTFDKIIMDYDISKQDSIYGRIVMDSKKKTISI